MTDFKDIIRTRRSIRKFLPTPVESDKVESILKAALLAPSGKRMYPCEFVVVDKVATLKALSECKAHGAKFLANAPLAVVVAVDTNKYDVWVEDASIASTFIMLAAEDCGLGCCWVQMRLRGTEDGASSSKNMRNLLNLPEGYEMLSVLAIGYKDEEKKGYDTSDLQYAKIHHNQIGNTIQNIKNK